MLILPRTFDLMGLLYAAPVADTLAFIVSFGFVAVQLKQLGKEAGPQGQAR